MQEDAPTNDRTGLARLFHWPRLLVAMGAALFCGMLNSAPTGAPPFWGNFGHAATAALAGVAVFGLLERHPRHPPKWAPNWLLQLLSVVFAVPLAVLVIHAIWMASDIHQAHQRPELVAMAMLVFEGLLFGPWIALAAMVRQREFFARHQALAFELERSKLERNALDTRLRLLQAQVQPHFLFNTLANVQALVEAGTPQASKVLANLIAYLRAAVPRINEPATMLGQEIDLVRAYLDLMRMRMPDRLDFTLRIDPQASTVPCPPALLLTLVENAVRHGIDPSEEGGRIDVDVHLRENRCIVRVSDTGVGLTMHGTSAGTGLATLRERLRLTYGDKARFHITSLKPHGACAELELPTREAI